MDCTHLNITTIGEDSGYSDAWRRVLNRLGDYTTIIVRALNIRPSAVSFVGQTAAHVLVRISTPGTHLLLRIAPEGDVAGDVYFARTMAAQQLPAARLVHADLSRLLAPFTYLLEGHVCGVSAAEIRDPHLLRAAARQLGRTLRRLHRVRAAGWGRPTALGRWPESDWRTILGQLHLSQAVAPLDALLFTEDERTAVAALLDHPVLALDQPQAMHGAMGWQALRCTTGEQHVQIEALVEPGPVVGGDGLLDLAAGLDPAYPPAWRTGLLEGYNGAAPLSPAEHERLRLLRILTCYWNACQRYARAEAHEATAAEVRKLLESSDHIHPGL